METTHALVTLRIVGPVAMAYLTLCYILVQVVDTVSVHQIQDTSLMGIKLRTYQKLMKNRPSKPHYLNCDYHGFTDNETVSGMYITVSLPPTIVSANERERIPQSFTFYANVNSYVLTNYK